MQVKINDQTLYNSTLYFLDIDFVCPFSLPKSCDISAYDVYHFSSSNGISSFRDSWEGLLQFPWVPLGSTPRRFKQEMVHEDGICAEQ